jgi:hypothetical protein
VKAPLEQYVEAIESHLKARRGVDHALSPRDFALARTWFNAGVSLATVLVGIDRAFDAGARVSSLAFCRRAVEELLASGPPLQQKALPRVESAPLPEVRDLLDQLLEGLTTLRCPGFEPCVRRIRELTDLLSVATRPNWDYVRGKLREIDEEVSAAVIGALPAGDVEALKAEARRAVDRHRGRVEEGTLEDAMLRYLVYRARERLRLPRVCL